MSEIGRVYLDANIFIFLFERKDNLSDLLAKLIVNSKPKEDPSLVTSELTLAETLVHPLRNRNDRLVELYMNWSLSIDYLEVGPNNREVLYHAANLRAHYPKVKLPDAIHLSTAIGFGCSHFLSADERLEGEYEAVNTRFGITKGPARLSAIRPSTEILTDMIDALC